MTEKKQTQFHIQRQGNLILRTREACQRLLLGRSSKPKDSIPKSLSTVIYEIGEASVVNVKNPSILPISSWYYIFQIAINLVHNHVYILIILPSKHVVLYVSQALYWNCAPCAYIVGLYCHSPAHAITIVHWHKP